MMIITDDKKKPLPPSPSTTAPSGSSSTGYTAASDLADIDPAEPPPYSPTSSTPAAPRDRTVDLLSGDASAYSAGPSVLPPPPPPPAAPYVDPIPADLPRQNRLRVHRDNHSVKETYVIDANLPAPPGCAEKNLDLYSNNGSVQARVFLVGEDVKRRVEIAAKSKNGSVKLSIAECPPAMRINVSAVSHNGSVTVFLPKKFRGPLAIENKNGGVTLFPSLKARTRTLEESSKVSRCWVGEWNGETEWEGDECYVSSHNGSVKVGFWEGEPPEVVGGGFFKRLFG